MRIYANNTERTSRRTGPRTVWLGPEAARLYAFWRGVREEAGLPGMRIHDCRHTWASQGVMNGVGLTTVGRLLGHRKRETIAIYAHLDDTALRDAAAQASGVIARVMGYRAEPPPVPEELLEEPGSDSGDSTPNNAADSSDSDSGDTDPSQPVQKRADEPTDHPCTPVVSDKVADQRKACRAPDTLTREDAAGLSGEDDDSNHRATRRKGYISI